MPSVKVVPDSGILIAAALTRGYAYDFLFSPRVIELSLALFTSSAILEEVQTKLENKFKLQRPIVAEYIESLTGIMTVVQPRQKLEVVRDPDDNKIVECAVEARAHIIVSADKDLLSMKKYRDIQIAHPSMMKYWFK